MTRIATLLTLTRTHESLGVLRGLVCSRTLFTALVALVSAIAPTPQAWAVGSELRELYRGTRAMGMGNAFVGLADDEQAIFYNPAGLPGIKKSTFYMLPLQGQVSGDILTGYKDFATAFGNISGDTLNVIMGKNYSFQGNVTPTYIGPGFGVSFIFDGQVGIYARNKSLPDIGMLYQQTMGVQGAFGRTIWRSSSKASELRAGLALKYLNRRGGYRKVPTKELLALDISKIKALFGEYGVGYGGDVGFQWIRRAKKAFTVGLGMAYTDIGDTTFASGADALQGNLSMGSWLGYTMGPFGVNLTADMRHLGSDTDWRKKLHIGTEFKLMRASVYLGMNQTFLTYGAGLDVWMVKAQAATYAEELGSFVRINPERRWVFDVKVKFDM